MRANARKWHKSNKTTLQASTSTSTSERQYHVACLTVALENIRASDIDIDLRRHQCLATFVDSDVFVSRVRPPPKCVDDRPTRDLQ